MCFVDLLIGNLKNWRLIYCVEILWTPFKTNFLKNITSPSPWKLLQILWTSWAECKGNPLIMGSIKILNVKKIIFWFNLKFTNRISNAIRNWVSLGGRSLDDLHVQTSYYKKKLVYMHNLVSSRSWSWSY